MPILNLKISGEPNAELARVLVNEITNLTEKHLKKKPAVTAITVMFVPKDFWFVNTQSLASLNQSSFYLDIKVTDSTNLKDEKADYIKAIFALMEAHLENIHTESYVYVEEVKADAYGFGGLTQEFRYIKSKI